MSFQQMLINGVLKEVARLHPGYAPIISFALSHETQLEKAGPIIAAAASEGPGALAAAEKAAPDLAKAIKDFAASVDDLALNPAVPPEAVEHLHAENVTRQIVGLQKMTPDEEMAWVERVTPPSDSKFGG